MNKKYLLIDASNTFFRAKHVAGKGVDVDTRVGLSIHIILSAIIRMWTKFDVDHVIFCVEGNSWRKDFYEPYKKNRVITRMKRTEKEVQEDELFFEAYNDLIEFVDSKTNATVLHHDKLEADDLIAGFIQSHPDDNHVIISSDSDFHQLIADNVILYNGVSETLVELSGFYDTKGNILVDKKTGLPKTILNPEWVLFEKCMRGDKSDNIFSALPGVRTKGTKNKIGLTEAFQDRNSKGYAWNNLMLQRWLDHDGIEHCVRDDYHRNVVLIDLTQQPENVRGYITETINSITAKRVPNIGVHFLKFCGKYQLNTISNDTTRYASMLGSNYGN